MSFDARAWMIWIGAAAVITMMARNPLYTLTMLLVIRLVAEVCTSPRGEMGVSLSRIGVVLLTFAIFFNGLSVHIGQTVLFRLPANWPWIGGPVTLEAVVFGASAGLILLTLLAVFTTFNGLVPSSQLVRLMPRALRDLGVVILIGITYVPETRRQLERIREAQAIRGHQLHGLRDWQPIVIPLLIGGLERAMGLAEAMVSRGYGATTGVRQPLSVQLGLVAGLLFALVGWVLTFWINWLGWLLLGGGFLLVTMLLLRLGRRTPSTRYRPRGWSRQDALILIPTVLALVLVFVPLPFVDHSTLAYSPYPSVSLPTFDPLIGLGLASLALPAAFATLK